MTDVWAFKAEKERQAGAGATAAGATLSTTATGMPASAPLTLSSPGVAEALRNGARLVPLAARAAAPAGAAVVQVGAVSYLIYRMVDAETQRQAAQQRQRVMPLPPPPPALTRDEDAPPLARPTDTTGRPSAPEMPTADELPRGVLARPTAPGTPAAATQSTPTSQPPAPRTEPPQPPEFDPTKLIRLCVAAKIGAGSRHSRA